MNEVLLYYGISAPCKKRKYAKEEHISYCFDACFITGPFGKSGNEERINGYKKALKESGIKFDMLILKYTDWTAEQEFHATRELLSLKRSPTAIIVTGDTCALGVFDGIDNEGLKVLEDTAVVSFDDMVFAPFLKVPLTTIRQPMKQLGNTAVELLFKKLASKFSASRKIILDTELIIRESCRFKKSQEENFKVK